LLRQRFRHVESSFDEDGGVTSVSLFAEICGSSTLYMI
jgi:hypothetical protein